MPGRQDILKSILFSRFSTENPGKLPSMDISLLYKYCCYQEVFSTYRSLGGIMNKMPTNFGKWDIVLDKFIVEFDEEQHFNRYRRLTLNSLIYSVTPHFDHLLYMKFCDIYEEECLAKASKGGYWGNRTSVKQFGKAEINGVLSGNGSPRWKQRAFYDYLRDVYSVVTGIPVVRISIHDELNIKGLTWTIDEILNRRKTQLYPYIIRILERQLEIK